LTIAPRDRSNVAMIGRLRAYLMLAAWALGLAILGPFCILLTILTGVEAFITIPTMFVLHVGFLLGGVKRTVVGVENVDPRGVYVYAPNHQSILDPPIVWLALGTPARRPGFLLKTELLRVPIFGIGVQKIGMIAVDRSDREKAIESARRAAERIAEGRSFVVFPEGTRTRDGGLLPFKKGAFHMAMASGVPIVPITIDGPFLAMPRGEMRLRPVPIRVTIHEPIPTAGLSEADLPDLIARTEARIASALATPPAPAAIR
jgi:1-acyl-sn-glycerol-3-phosphate acyltransferase